MSFLHVKKVFSARKGSLMLRSVFSSGFARIRNVEFSHCGQYNYVDPTDPRFTIAFLDVGTNIYSVFTNNSIRYSYNSGLGTFGMSGLTVANNVMLDTVGAGE